MQVQHGIESEHAAERFSREERRRGPQCQVSARTELRDGYARQVKPLRPVQDPRIQRTASSTSLTAAGNGFSGAKRTEWGLAIHLPTELVVAPVIRENKA